MGIHRFKEITHSMVFLQKELRELMKGQLAKLRKEMGSRLLTVEYHTESSNPPK